MLNYLMETITAIFLRKGDIGGALRIQIVRKDIKEVKRSWDLRDECILEISQYKRGDVTNRQPQNNQGHEELNGLCAQISNEDSLDHRLQMENTWW